MQKKKNRQQMGKSLILTEILELSRVKGNLRSVSKRLCHAAQGGLSCQQFRKGSTRSRSNGYSTKHSEFEGSVIPLIPYKPHEYNP